MNNCVLGFNGERLDPVSGTTHLGNGYRAYNPVLMRFNCPDSMSPFGAGGINSYVYCAGDPVNQADPSGHWSLGQWIGLAVGIVAGIALGIATAGAAMPAVLTLMALAAGGAAIGAGSELVTEAVDGLRVNWGQVGISAGIGAAAELVGYGVGKGLSTAYRAIKGSLSGATGRLAAGAGYAPEQVAQYDRIALRGLRRGGGLPGGTPGPNLTKCVRPLAEEASEPLSIVDRTIKEFRFHTRDELRLAYRDSPETFYRGSRYPINIPAPAGEDIDQRLVAALKHTASHSGSAGEIQSFSSSEFTALNYANGKRTLVTAVNVQPGDRFISTAEILNEHAERLVENGLVLPGTVRSAIHLYFGNSEREYFWISASPGRQLDI